ncbi:pro-neuregulin-3%2C membrane-bound isoform [Xyrichtys novacula]|uniref:Pro-neuregulin-3, membrane-bound isoform n=1 Tax=Xyrichtys novacula TaxID=13765 RepID=A0AAV1G0T4_XYRNO|nr:pro-neuregulin-3%2C membrane-bound isoform [Xyrichtys novacula]
MSHKGRQGRMSECSGAAVSGAVILEEPEGSGASGGRGEGQAQGQGPVRCAVWPRQQTWLCVVPLLIGFIGLGLSLMLLKWIVVGTVRDYVPTDLVDANRIGQDPIFLSKPSGIPKSPDTTTTTTPTVDGGNPTPRTVTAAKGRTRSTATTTTINPRGGGASGSQVTPRNPGNRNGRGPSSFTTTTAASRTTSTIGVATSSPSPSNPTVLHDSTQMWTPEHTTTETASTTLSTRTHGHRKTPSPTVPPLHSEHFKPCHEKDLAYCLNGGECFVIETLSGPHKHCKCREGYQGIRCDQFLPKTDSILSDPNHLGIEFMESKEVYKRQVLSITSIAMAISLLGTLCMALYCRNKCQMQGEIQCDDPRRDSFLHMQTPVSLETTPPSSWRGHIEVRSGLEDSDPNAVTRSLHRPGRRHSHSLPPPFRSCSIPIIPSVQCHHDNEVSCMQTNTATTTMSVNHRAMTSKDVRNEKVAQAKLSSSSCSSAIGQQHDEVALLLKEAQEQLRALALAHRKQEEIGTSTRSNSSSSSSSSSTTVQVEARETVCFLNLSGGSAGALSCNGPTQTQLLSPCLSHRDLGQSSQ